MGFLWRRVIARTVAILMAAMSLAVVQPTFGAPAHDQAATYTFTFQDADVGQVAQAVLGDALGLSYTVDSGVTGKMSFRIDRRLTAAQLLAAFEAALETNDAVMVRQGDSVLIEPRSKAKGAGEVRSLSEGVRAAGYQTVAVPLSYAAPSEVAKALAATGRTDMVVEADDKLNLLILGGTGPELQVAVELIRTFDHSGLEESKIRFFELEQAPAETVAHDLSAILEGAGIGGVAVVPLRRMNGLFVFARSTQALDEVGRWVAKLDVPSQEKTGSLWVYHPKNTTAESLAETLTSVLTGELPAPAPAGGPPAIGSQIAAAPANSYGAPARPMTGPSAAASLPAPMAANPADPDAPRVGLDREANTLLIFAPPARWVQIQKILDEIDQPPRQVMIQASIVEVDLSKQDNAGIDWSAIGANGQLTVASINSPTKSVSAEVPGFSVAFLGRDFKIALNALGTNSTMEILSEPKIIVLDNHTAQLDVGDQLPVVTQTGQNTTAPGSPIVNSINYVNTGVILNVTPRIGGDDKLYLDIDQEVSSGTATTTSGIDSPTISTRKIQTTLMVQNGGIVALGGLISSNRTRGDSGLPYLKDVPLLGYLFKNKTDTTTRNELVVLIKADIIQDHASSSRAMADLLADMKELERRGWVTQ